MQALFMDEDDQLVSFAPRKQKIQKTQKAREADFDRLQVKRKEKIRDRNRHSKNQHEFA